MFEDGPGQEAASEKIDPLEVMIDHLVLVMIDHLVLVLYN